MRALPIAVLFSLAACAPTTEELITEANISGDWTAVNARIAIEEEMYAEPLECGSHFILFCETSAIGESCGCVVEDDFNDWQRDLALRRGNNRRH